MRIFTSILCVALFLFSGCTMSEEAIKSRNEISNKNAQATLDRDGLYIGIKGWAIYH
jgi:starvation-inducible outer membrane lipoprotein